MLDSRLRGTDGTNRNITLTAPLLQCAGEISRGKSTTGLAILRMLDITQGRIVCMPVSARAAAAA